MLGAITTLLLVLALVRIGAWPIAVIFLVLMIGHLLFGKKEP